MLSASVKLCSIPDCGAPARTRGLCRKHYTHLRRYGDPIVKPLPGNAETAAILLEQFPERSPRTRARFARAMRLAALMRYHKVENALEDAIRHATGPNGSLNFGLLLQHLEDRAGMLAARLARSGVAADGDC